jgi:hypothetical protein
MNHRVAAGAVEFFGIIASFGAMYFLMLKHKPDEEPCEKKAPPWTAEVTPNCFIVHDADRQQLAYVYYESEPGRRSAAKLLTKDEARRIGRILRSCRN